MEFIMKIVLTGINAKYIHTNLAIRYLKAYASEYKNNIILKEFTINNYMDDILQGIYKEKPDFLGLSCYIWNLGMIRELCVELKKVLPKTKIWLGGPEVSYDGKEYLESNLSVDGIMVGEGEETFLELLDYYVKGDKALHEVKGIIYRKSALKDIDINPNKEDDIVVTRTRPLLNFNDIPFCYDNIEEFENKIIYYETSRGCPYSCSYCLSSIDKSVRLRDVELVKKELSVFLDAKVPQVKFVDRTFNCNRRHTEGIINYIKEHDNGITNFHFEVSADILNEEELALFQTLRKGLVQLEIGVQSTNDETIDAIHRKMSFEKLKQIVARIKEGNNIHAHLDLIVGLPYEDYHSFRNSFNDVYALDPDQFQLGFLKVLKGSQMFYDSSQYGIVYKSEPPYEVLYTNWLTYDEVLLLKGVEEMVEVYYNSSQFTYGIKYMEHFFDTPFELYNELAHFYEEHLLTGMNHARMKRYEILIDFMKEQLSKKPNKNMDIDAFSNILVHDLYLRENLKSRPKFANDIEQYKSLYRDFYNDEKLYEYLEVSKEEYRLNQLKPYVHLEHYEIDIYKTVKEGKTIKTNNNMLYDYMHRDPLNFDSKTQIINL
jgi:radical SAM superfamily enzyme YgiQ (UPF0313 family)